MDPTADAMTALDRLIAAADDGRLDRFCEQHGIQLLGAFGSTVAHHLGQSGPGARGPEDLDVAVRFAGEGDPVVVINGLMDLTEFDHVDLAVLNDALPVLRVEAFLGLGLYEDRDGAWANAQIAAFGEFRDTAHLRRLNLMTLAS